MRKVITNKKKTTLFNIIKSRINNVIKNFNELKLSTKIIILFIVAMSVSFHDSFAEVTEWKGVTTGNTKYSNQRGWTSGYFYVHLAKNK